MITNRKYENLVFEYLKDPANKNILEKIVLGGEEAFDCVRNYKGPMPTDPRDGEVELTGLLGAIGSQHPNLIEKHINAKNSLTRWRYINAAISSDNPKLAELIISFLDDRSYYIKDLIIDSMKWTKFIRIPPAIQGLEKILAGKSINHLVNSRKEIEQLIRKIKRQL